MTPERWRQIKDVLASVLDADPSLRSAYLDQVCANDRSLRSEVEGLLAAEQGADAKLLRPPTTVNEIEIGEVPQHRSARIGRRIGAYQILEEIGVGGMGEVYRAFRADDHYQKEVAIKLVRTGHDSRFVITRFKNERQVLASLDHPNIARLLDGGSTDDGQPYLVMEYIQGQPLDQYCDERKLTVTERLRLFRTVCSAVQCAHQNLVIHRDLKPGNILVTGDGTPKLLDFGIAKMLDPDSTDSSALQTMTMMRLLTPDYASPEQLCGETITTASDVYSLGVVLYELLTGCRPRRLNRAGMRIGDKRIDDLTAEAEPEKPSLVAAQADSHSNGQAPDRTARIAENISARREASPEKLRRRLSGDLDNIVLMALRPEPARRYASVEQLSEDIRRHLEGLPVIARAPTFVYRSSKFIRRHTAAVVTVSLLGLSLIGGAAATLREARIAHVQRERAERRFNDVRQLANSLMFDIHDAIRDLPGSTQARHLLVDRALQYLDSLSRESANVPDLQRELAAAYERVGDVQGNPRYANLGDTAGAIASYRKAVRLRLALADDGRGSADDQMALSAIQVKLGFGLGATNDFPAALDVLQRAYPIAQRLAVEQKDNPQAQAAFAGVSFALGECLADMGNLAGALEYYRKSVAIREAITGGSPAFRMQAQIDLAGVYDYMSEAVYLQGDIDAALFFLNKAHDIMAGLVGSDRQNATLRQFLVQEEYETGYYLTEKKLPKQALQHYRVALAGYRKLASSDAHDVVAMRYVSKCYTGIGRALAADGKPAQGIQSARKALRNLEALSAADQADTYYKGPDLAYARFALGETYSRFAMQPGLSETSKIASWREARSWYQKSLDTWLLLKRKAPLARWDAAQPDKIASQIARCDSALAKLYAHPA